MKPIKSMYRILLKKERIFFESKAHKIVFSLLLLLFSGISSLLIIVNNFDKTQDVPTYLLLIWGLIFTPGIGAVFILTKFIKRENIKSIVRKFYGAIWLLFLLVSIIGILAMAIIVDGDLPQQ